MTQTRSCGQCRALKLHVEGATCQLGYQLQVTEYWRLISVNWKPAAGVCPKPMTMAALDALKAEAAK